MESLQRINVKFYLEDPESLSAEEAFRIFNSWIRRPQTKSSSTWPTTATYPRAR